MAAASPSGLETRYRRLLGVLEGPVSGRWAVLRLDEFLSRLGAKTSRAESYLLSLAEPMAEQAAQLDPIGLRPAHLASLAARLRKALEARPAVREHGALSQAERHLRRRAGLLYGYAGATQRAVECAVPPGSSAAEGNELVVKASEVEGAPRERVVGALEHAENAGLRSGLEWMLDRWARPAEEGAFVPVVERLSSWVQSGPDDAPRVGGLRHLAVQIHGPAEARDRLRINASAQGSEGSSLTDGPVAAARRLLDRRCPRLKESFVEGRVTEGRPAEGSRACDRTDFNLEGRSAGLAIAALFYGAVLRHTHRRERAGVQPEVLLTGDLAPDGTVQPVGEGGLPLKVQTAFFSPKTRLAVPAPQREEAQSRRDELLQEFPHGRLEVIGIERLEGLFYDRRLTEQVRIGWARHVARRLWDRRGQVVAGAIVLGLLAVIGALLYGPLEKNPASAQFRGSTLTVENASGRVLEELEVGRGLVRKVEKGKAKRPVAFADVAGGERKELIWGASPAENARMDVLRAKAVGADTLLWERPLRFEVNFPGKPEVTSPTFGIADLTAEDLNRDGRPELYALANHRPYFPSLLLQLDPANGQAEQRYVHPGHLRSGIETADLTSGPAPELLVGGHSNAFGDPVLAMLRPSGISGRAPTRGDYAVGGADLAAHVAYLRFPSTALQEQRPTDYPMVWRVRPALAAKTLEVVAQDGRVPEGSADRPLVISTLGYDLRPRSIGTDGTYDRLADSLVQRGALGAVPGPEALRLYGEQIQYWTGSSWSREPTFVYRPEGQ